MRPRPPGPGSRTQGRGPGFPRRLEAPVIASFAQSRAPSAEVPSLRSRSTRSLRSTRPSSRIARLRREERLRARRARPLGRSRLALVAAIAADALGPERVVGVVMPSPTPATRRNPTRSQIARNLGIELIEIPIERRWRPTPLRALSGDGVLRDVRDGEGDVAEENMQARIRGNLVMALSNRNGWLVLTTGNKSELAVGYSTLYGDMAGGFAVLKDVPKTLVYQLARYRNEREGRELVLAYRDRACAVRRAAPRPARRDSLPPYDVLDRILEAYVERDQSLGEIVGDAISRRSSRT